MNNNPNVCTNEHAHQIAVLIKSALDAARLLDYAQAPNGLNSEEIEECRNVRDRLYAACDTLHPEEDDIEMMRRLVGAARFAGCDEEPAGYGWSAI